MRRLSLFLFALSYSLPAIACSEGFISLIGPTGAFCVQATAKASVRSFEAAGLCEEQGARLCTDSELRVACESGRAEGAGLGWEWSFSLDHYVAASLNGSCDALAFGELTHHAGLRCCK